MAIISCINCKAQLNIVAEMDSFECGHCGFPLQVVRDQETVTLKRRGPIPLRSSTETPPGPAQIELDRQLPKQDDPVALRMRKELEAAITVRDAKAKAEEQKGFGWVIAIPLFSAVFFGWWSLLVFLIAGCWWGIGAKERESQVIATHAPHIGQLQRQLEIYLGGTSGGRTDSMPMSGRPVTSGSAVTSRAAGSDRSASDIGKIMLAGAGGALAGSALAAAGKDGKSDFDQLSAQSLDAPTLRPLDETYAADLSYKDSDANFGALKVDAPEETFSRGSHDESTENSDESNSVLEQTESGDADVGSGLDCDFDL